MDAGGDGSGAGHGLAALASAARSVPTNLALMRALRRSPQDFLAVLIANGAGVATGAGRAPLWVGTERVLLVEDAADAWELLTTHARRTGKGRGMVRARLLLGNGLLTSEGEDHLHHRRVLQPAFHPRQVARYGAQFVLAARRAGDRWSDGGDIDLVAEVSAMTLDGAGSSLFGADLREPSQRITRALTDLLAGFRLAIAPGGRALVRSPLPAATRLRAARAELEGVLDDLIGGRWSAPAPAPAPVLELLAAQPELTDQQQRDEVVTLLLAGHETTAMALTWALAALDREPAVRADLEREWDGAGGPGGVDPGAASLPLTMAVLAETLRLWPPSWMFTRRVLEPVVLHGRTVPVGTMCLVSPALLHRDPRWWSEPDAFRPHRWLRQEPGERDRFDPRAPGQPRGAYLPFGAGPRMCIGEQFAWAEGATMLAELGRRWSIHVHHAPLRAGPSSMTLRPREPVRATTVRRSA